MADLRNVFRRTPPSALMHAAMLLLTGLLPCMALGVPGAIAVFMLGWPLAAMMHAAASVSCIGAEPGIFLYPRFESGSPEVSRYIMTSSLSQ